MTSPAPSPPSSRSTEKTVSVCLHCGPSPVPHLATWIDQSFTVLMQPLDRALSGGLFERVLDPLSNFFFNGLVSLLAALKLATFLEEPTDKTPERTRVLWEAAKARGIAMRGVLIFGRDLDTYQARVAGRRIIFQGLPRPTPPKNGGERWMDDKETLKKKLSAAKIPVPRGKSFSRLAPLKKYFAELEKPVIVKPRVGSRGRHTTTFIYSTRELEEAYRVAKQFCHWVVLEEHLTGSVYRATMIDGKLVGVLGGSPPRITGDGAHSVRELIAIKNKTREARVGEVIATPATEKFLARLKLTLDTILPKNKTIDLTEKIGVRYGGTSFDATDETHPETKRILEKAAAVVNDRLMGFDFIIEKISDSPAAQKWGIIECNSLPFINLHYDPLIGKTRPVAGFVWDLWEK